MLIIREVLTAKPGQASKLAKLFKKVFGSDPNPENVFVRLTSDLAEDYHIIAYSWIFSYFLQKYDIVHLNSKKLTIGLYIYQNIIA
jgi:hypothetical protein